MFKWPPLFKAVIFCTKEEEWRISGHLSAAARLNGTQHFRQYRKGQGGDTDNSKEKKLHNEEVHNLYFTQILLG
jgi:hypothetical protein